uniref:HAT C-terminal dimerisation domain-containing protein n=1 Tax=Chaetoceros debilis TaxID=122233 RepID=A0A7S3PTX0_9STRA
MVHPFFPPKRLPSGAFASSLCYKCKKFPTGHYCQVEMTGGNTFEGAQRCLRPFCLMCMHELDYDDKTMCPFHYNDKGVHLFVNGSNADKGFNSPLQWWKQNHREYPNIWMLAKRILSVPATSAPSERVFSVASLIATKKRGSLKPDNVNMLVFLKENFDLIEW